MLTGEEWVTYTLYQLRLKEAVWAARRATILHGSVTAAIKSMRCGSRKFNSFLDPDLSVAPDLPGDVVFAISDEQLLTLTLEEVEDLIEEAIVNDALWLGSDRAIAEWCGVTDDKFIGRVRKRIEGKTSQERVFGGRIQTVS